MEEVQYPLYTQGMLFDYFTIPLWLVVSIYEKQNILDFQTALSFFIGFPRYLGHSIKNVVCGGWRIRTSEGIAPQLVFETSALDRSANPPYLKQVSSSMYYGILFNVLFFSLYLVFRW